MATIKIDAFAGIVPRTHPTLLPDGCAVRAHNCRLKTGVLSPIRQPSMEKSKVIYLEGGLNKIGDAKSIHLWKRKGGESVFLAWEGIVTVAPSNIADDDLSRIFVTGETGRMGAEGTSTTEPWFYVYSKSHNALTRVKMLYDTAPKPVVSLVEEAPSDPDNVRYTFFFQAWVDQYGYESPVSEHSFNTYSQDPFEVEDGSFQYSDGDKVGVEAVPDPPGYAALRRIYKVVAGSEGEQIQYVVEQKRSGGSFPAMFFALKDDAAGEILPIINAPPKDLSWMSYMPGAFYVGLSPSSPRTVFFSDVNRPTSWPVFYQYDIREDAVGLAVVGNTALVLTKGSPWIISGSSPEAMLVTSTASPQACVSSRSICTMLGAVFYASADGICMFTPDSINVAVLTEKYLDKREWDELNPESCFMVPYDNALHAWFDTKNRGRIGYTIDINDGVSAITTHDEVAKGVHYDVETDALYFVREV